MIEKKIAAGDARSEFATLINEVAFGKTRAILTRRGRDIAAIVPIEDIDLIKRLENMVDSEKLAARRNESTERMGDVAVRLGLSIPAGIQRAKDKAVPTKRKASRKAT